MTFTDKLTAIQDKNNSLLCIGLDPVLEKIPEHLQEDTHPFFNFNKAIIDATPEYVCAYKPNSAFYEARGDRGIAELKATCDYIRIMYPEIPIILDFKRGDIGSTNDGYATYAFDFLQVDAVTLHPYLGKESLAPFFRYPDKGLIFLCRTSNPGSGEFQNLEVSGQPLYQHVAQQVSKTWNSSNNCLLVVGATYPDELQRVREIVGDMTLLVPGIGAQGGEVEATVKAGLNSQRKGMIISSSRAILFADSSPNFAQKAKEVALTTRDEINQYR